MNGRILSGSIIDNGNGGIECVLCGSGWQDTAAQSINFAWLYNSRIVARKNHNFLAAAPG